MSNARFDRAAWPFGVALLIAVGTRLAFPFDGLYGQDAFAYFRFARAIGPHLLHGAPLPDMFWPRGYPAAIAVWLPLAGGGPFAGQVVSALACAWAASATYLLVREVEPPGADATARIIAGMCVAGSGIALRAGQVVMADGLSMGLAATALWCAARYVRRRQGAWLLPCAVTLAWGAVTRWQVGLLAFPLLAAIALAWKEPVGAERRTSTALWCVTAALAALVILVPQLVTSHAVPYSFQRHEWLQRWNPWNAFLRDFDVHDGHVHYRLPVGLFYLVRTGWPDALFPPLAALAIVGAWTLLRQRRAVAAAMLIGWPLTNWAFISAIPYENPRYLWSGLPAIGALVGIGYGFARDRLGSRGRAVLAVAAGASIAAGLAFGAREHAHTVARKNDERASVTWVDAHVPAGTTLLMTGGTLIFESYGSSTVRDTYLLSPSELAEAVLREGRCMYLSNADALGKSAEARAQLEELAKTPGLEPVAARAPLLLFRVGPRS